MHRLTLPVAVVISVISVIWVLASGGCTASSHTTADRQAPAQPLGPPTVIHVADFVVAQPSPEGGGGLRPGLLHAVRSELSQAQLVGRLADQIVADLRTRGYAAERGSHAALTGAAGWLVEGTFVEHGPEGGPLAKRFGSASVELFLRMHDLERGVPQPMVRFDVAGTASGEGLPMMPNAYAAAAKFVVRQAELDGDASSLAKRVAAEIEHVARTHQRGSGG